MVMGTVCHPRRNTAGTAIRDPLPLRGGNLPPDRRKKRIPHPCPADTPVFQSAAMNAFTGWLYLRVRHALRVAGVAFFVLAFVAAVGLFFGLVLLFGRQWADLEERSREK
jgi:hypothetical protein